MINTNTVGLKKKSHTQKIVFAHLQILNVKCQTEQVLGTPKATLCRALSWEAIYPLYFMLLLPNMELYKINVEKIWDNQLPDMFSRFQSLTQLIQKLKYIFSASAIRSFQQLQHLEICNYSTTHQNKMGHFQLSLLSWHFEFVNQQSPFEFVKTFGKNHRRLVSFIHYNQQSPSLVYILWSQLQFAPVYWAHYCAVCFAVFAINSFELSIF